MMEATIVAIYDINGLSAEVLDKIMEPYKHTDCDSGGSCDLKAKDGLGVEEIICKIMKPKEYADVVKNPKYYEKEKPSWCSNERAYELFTSIWKDTWNIC